MSQPTSSDINQLTTAIRSLEQTIKQQTLFHRRGSNIASQGIVLPQTRPSRPSFAETQATVRPPTRNDKVIVYLRVVFMKVGEIDTLKQKYAADVFIQAKWRDPSLDGKTATEAEDVDWDVMWNPKLFVENVYGEGHTESVWHTLHFDPQERATVTEKRRISGSFLEYLELNQFPFDTQDLTITVSSELSEAAVDLQEDQIELSGINVQSFVDEQEWYLHSHVETWRKITTKVQQNTQHKHSALSAACKASRRPGFFIWNILFVMLFICSLSFSTFTVEIKLPQNRLQLSFILLLTTVTFKFIVNQSLPRISYLTYLDKYILTSMSILCCICVWHAVVPVIWDNLSDASAVSADRIALITFGVIYVAFHMLFVIWILCIAKRRSVHIVKKDEAQKERLKFLDSDTGAVAWNQSKVSLKSVDEEENGPQSTATVDKKPVGARRVLPLLEEAA